ncbi:HPr kinase/phosphatase C-terminal domain-containing protein [Bosea sp. 117]|uniref:HPr kinase/phosphorylase n=1 Tax=Bosea sp. 117 TaxID=1125973 RepID=UPI000494A667|nr:HPr kinase/phosphatase C-terminal domain-containing protein [Bosea sp. 117]
MLVVPPSIHASCVAVGETGVLIRGPSGSGKSRLAFQLILAARSGLIGPTLLVADDRVLLARRGDGLVATPPADLAGLIEVRGAGIRRVPHAASAVVGLVVDLSADDGARLPDPDSRRLQLDGVVLPRLALPAGVDPLPPVIAVLTTEAVPD